jgi:hypothetical protein
VSRRNLVTSLLALVAGLTIGVIVDSAIAASLSTLLFATVWVSIDVRANGRR